jgi:hypothetical protein
VAHRPILQVAALRWRAALGPGLGLAWCAPPSRAPMPGHIDIPLEELETVAHPSTAAAYDLESRHVVICSTTGGSLTGDSARGGRAADGTVQVFRIARAHLVRVIKLAQSTHRAYAAMLAAGP